MELVILIGCAAVGIIVGALLVLGFVFSALKFMPASILPW